MNLFLDVPLAIRRETDNFSDSQIQDAITIMFGPDFKLGWTVAPELQAQDINRKVMEMLRSSDFHKRWYERQVQKRMVELEMETKSAAIV
jgi:hypothetical protein